MQIYEIRRFLHIFAVQKIASLPLPDNNHDSTDISMKLLRLAACAACAAATLLTLSAKKKQTPAPKPAPVRVAWNTGMQNPDGTPADSTEMWIARPAEGKANGTTVVMIPGGGYAFVSMQNEGYDWLDWFTGQGYTVGILKYRLPKGNPDMPIDDAQRAVGFFKQHAAEFDIDPSRVGVMGFSAGGHLAASTAVAPVPDARMLRQQPAGALTRPMPAGPDFQVLVYPVISLTPQLTHSDSRNNFLGKDATPEMVLAYSPELHVTSSTPTAFILATNDDPIVKPGNSIAYYHALTDAGVPVSLHVYPTGGHGFGFSTDFPAHNQMIDELSAWLQTLGK